MERGQINSIVVYGTLRYEQDRWSMLEKFFRVVSTKTIGGFKLFTFQDKKTGRMLGWPGAQEGTIGDKMVIDLCEYKGGEGAPTFDRMIERLDGVEGVDTGLFHRTVVEIDGRQAYIYLIKRDMNSEYKPVQITDWSKFVSGEK